MHLSEAELDTWLDRGETALESPRREHLARCERCSARLAELRDEASRTDELLSVLDHELPRVDADAVIHRAGRGERRRALALAAGVAGLLIAGAAVAVPGSPLREWIAGRPAPEVSVDPGSTVIPPPAEALPGPGVRFVPTGPVEVSFEAAQESGHITVIRFRQEELSVHAVNGSAAFSVGSNRVQVGNQGSSATYELRVPTSLPTFRIVIAGTTVLEVVESRVMTPPGLDASLLQGGYRLTFASPGDAPR